MALPDLRLLRDDLFVINRLSNGVYNTYKVEIQDIGVFLLETPRPPGTSPEDKYINDGPLNVYGEIPNSARTFINLHSANEYCEGKLNFKKGFYITGSDMDVTVEHDYAEIGKNLACLNGGIDASGTCMQLDMEWLAENIICNGKGLDNSCGIGIGIDLCDHSGLVFRPSGCIEVNLCPGRGINHGPNDGCLEIDLEYLSTNLSCDGLKPGPGGTCITIDMEWLSNNIRCGDLHDPNGTNSGLIDGGGCLEVDPCWVSDRWNTDNPNVPIDTGSIDIEQCRVAINEDWLLDFLKDNINEISTSGDCISGGGNLFEQPVDIALNVDCIIGKVCDQNNSLTISYDGTTIDTYSPCDGDKLIDIPAPVIPPIPPAAQDGKLKITAGTGISINRVGGQQFGANQPDGDLVEWTINATGGGGSGSPPTVACNKGGLQDGTTSGGDPCLSIDLCANSGLHIKNSGCLAVDPDECLDYQSRLRAKKFVTTGPGTAGQPAIIINAQEGKNSDGDTHTWTGFKMNTGSEMLSISSGTGYNNSDNCTGSCEGGKNIMQIVNVTGAGNARFESVGIGFFGDGDQQPVYGFGQKGGPPGGGNALTRLTVATKFFRRGQITEITRDTDARVDVDIDAVLDAFAGYSDDPTTSNGLFRWGLKKADGTEDLANRPTHPYLFLDKNEVAAVLPGLVDFIPAPSAYDVTIVYEQDEDGNDTTVESHRLYEIKADFDPATDMIPARINEFALHGLALAALRKQKARIEELEAKTTLDGTLTTLGIVKYTNETAAANSGLGQGEVYFDLSLNRLRAVT